MVKKFLAVAALVVVLASSWMSASLAGQRDHLRHRVGVLEQRIAFLEEWLVNVADVASLGGSRAYKLCQVHPGVCSTIEED